MQSRRVFLASAATSLATGLANRLGAADTRSMAGVALEPFDDLLTQFIAANAVPGAALAVTRDGKLVYARGYGYADREQNKPVAPTATFRIASISKPITAVAILQLVEVGKIKLDDPALKYVQLKPFLANGAKVDDRWAKVTLRQCLQHTGGWDRSKAGGFDPIGMPARIMQEMKLNAAPTPEDVVRYMMGKPVDFDPGTRYAYSNLGFLVLGRVIETVTGAKYEPWVRKHVLTPVQADGMYLGLGLPENRTPAEVTYYDSKQRTGPCLYAPRKGEQVPLPDGANNIEGYEAHGGWVASAIDLVRFSSAFDEANKSPLLSRESIKEMWAPPPHAAKNSETYYACGWNVRPIAGKGNDKRNAWHSGLIPGTSTILVRRWDGLNWAVLFNTEASHEGKVLSGLIDLPMHIAADAVESWPS